jgi:tRNA(fMet)-specific endonuclease VapC
MIVLDTDHLSELERLASRKGTKLRERLAQVPDRPVATTIVSVEEQLRGRLAVINEKRVGIEQGLPYTRLIELIEFYSGWPILPFDQIAVERFHNLRAARIRIGTMDLKIAAIVLALGATLLSANLRDFRQVPGLSVEDWLAGE